MALQEAYAAHTVFMNEVRLCGERIIVEARKAKKPIIVLAGRPYHVDPKVNHGIDRLITTMGAALVSEDAVSCCIENEQEHNKGCRYQKRYKIA